ncbi:MAG: class I SAM-dependent methyltransferase [Planctomycetaceae bacterium]|nr:MAG: class I SAM-dependent methyltransferase [Planctomycetaceae bacterium]
MDQHEQQEFFYEIFDASLPRLGPGDEASTKRALDTLLSTGFLRERAAIDAPWRILDVGCGNGAQTIELAKHTPGMILAIDNHQPCLDELQRRAGAAGVWSKIRLSLRDMRTLTADDGPFDLVWSEGALFVMGFREGVAACRSLLAPGGGLAVSELCWLRSDPPAECREFFAGGYPAMTDISANLAAIRGCGCDVIEHFTQPESAWWEPYYLPLQDRLHMLRDKYAADSERLSMLESIQKEIDIYRRYSAYYGNVFFVMRSR